MAVARQQVLIGGAHRADQQPVLHRPAVDEQILMIGDAAVEGRQARPPRRAAPARAHNRSRGCSPASSRSVSAATRAGRSSPGWTWSVRRPSCSSVKPMSGRAMASRFTTSRQAAYSLRSERRNLRRAGTLANSSSTVTRVPGGSAAGPSPASLPLSTIRDQPSRAAHPAFDRHPGDAGDRRQRLAAKAQGGRPASIASSGSLEVACRSSASAISSCAMPQPSSATSIRPSPPADKADRDPRRAGVDRVFDQLFQRTGRSFHHFTGCDAVDEMLGQAAY